MKNTISEFERAKRLKEGWTEHPNGVWSRELTPAEIVDMDNKIREFKKKKRHLKLISI